MKFLKILVILSLAVPVMGQEPSPFDFGRMWTFENPPKKWFEKTYHLNADDAWFEKARMSALRFATWCSASFVSPDGLVMTNRHCSGSEIGPLQREGEDFDRDGFYAAQRSDERRADGLFVEQLVKVEDITNRVLSLLENITDDAQLSNARRAAFQTIQGEYSQKPGWEDLRLQIVTFYSGAKFSIYGYKRYDDVRLVFIPERNVGFFGGDPDNFTYPRYDLDVTFWRVYDETGLPLDTRNNYFKFNEDGAAQDEPVFVVGNPGSTERYRTVSQLEYDRDYRYPLQIAFLQQQYDMLAAEYAATPTHDIKEDMLSTSNSLKAFTGIVNGLKDPELFGRKVAMEKMIRSHSDDQTPWDYLTETYNKMGPELPELQFLSPVPQINGNAVTLLHVLYQMKQQLADDENADISESIANIREYAAGLSSPDEVHLLANVLRELKEYANPEDTYIDKILDGRTPEATAAAILDKTDFANPKKLDKLLDKKPAKIAATKDILMDLTDMLMPDEYAAIEYFQTSGPLRRAAEEKVAKAVFKVFGDDLPPDATFTLRISDGVVKGYPYNGTMAPYKTTYYGLYDRYYSNDKQDPWSLPERWSNPSTDLLKSPMNFVATTDIIGGNSGSAMINAKQEVVGLAFDGNIESLPGDFIFDEKVNRTVAVHAGGILAALRYVYKAGGLVDELTK